MTAEQWKEVYNEFYYFKNQIDNLCDDYYLAKDKGRAKQIMDDAYYKVKYNPEILSVFNERGNVDDLKEISQFSFAITSFLVSIDKITNQK